MLFAILCTLDIETLHAVLLNNYLSGMNNFYTMSWIVNRLYVLRASEAVSCVFLWHFVEMCIVFLPIECFTLFLISHGMVNI